MSTERLIQISIIISFIAFVVGSIEVFIKKRKKQKDAAAKLKQFAENNTPLDQPCTITIAVICNNSFVLDAGWPYGFSLNGAPPEFTKMYTVMTIQTNVQHNALLGYGRTGINNYDRPNPEEPFVFDAVSGGEIKLKANVFYDAGDRIWKSNLAFDHDVQNGQNPE